MRTANEMYSYARKNDYTFDNSNALKHFEVIEKNLLPDEEVLMALVSNSVYNGAQIVMGGITAVAFTNKRLIYGQKAILMGTPVKIVNLENINDIHKDTGFVYGKIYIDTLKENIGIEFPKTKLDKIFVDIVQMLENYKSSQNNGANAVVSAADEIKKFKELLDMGAITQDEYNEKKKQLLGL